MSDTCPKCGAPEFCRGVSGYDVIYGCDAGKTKEGFWVDSWQCIRKVVADLTARAEKAEEELRQLVALDRDTLKHALARAEKAEHDAKQCRFAVALAQEVIAKAEARAEKAEAEVTRLRNAVGLRDRLRYEYVEETVETLAKRCRWCGRMERDGCDPRICPTVTHPAEATNANS